MSEGTDVNDLQTLMKEYKRQKQESERKVTELSGKISRLEEVYNSLTPIKERLETSQKAQKQNAEDDTTYHEWTGTIRDNVSYLYSSEVTREYTNYVNLVDDLHDEVLREIGNLKSQRASESSLIGKLGGWIYQLDAEIKAFLN